MDGSSICLPTEEVLSSAGPESSEPASGKIEWLDAPEDFFYLHGLHEGLSHVDPPSRPWLPRPKGTIAGVAASSHLAVNEAAFTDIRRHHRFRDFRNAIEFQESLCQLRDARFVDGLVSSGGHWLQNGATGVRLHCRYILQRRRQGDDSVAERIEAVFAQVREASNFLCQSPVLDDKRSRTVAIECKNFFNYFHFLTETLPRLLTVANSGQAIDRLLLHAGPKRIAPFLEPLLAFILPQLSERIDFISTDRRYDAVCSTIDPRFLYFQTNRRTYEEFGDYCPRSWIWKPRVYSRQHIDFINRNSYSNSLRLLRKVGIERAEAAGGRPLPERVYITRRVVEFQRQRSLEGEDAVMRLLASRGFTVLAFEDLSPADQIRLAHGAKILVTQHGAGLANMLFANPEAHFIEIGNIQTLRYRWSDFIPLAHLSRCRYTQLVVDTNDANPSEIPTDFKIHELRIGDPGLRALARLVDGAQPVELMDPGMATYAQCLAAAS